jgi:hypothetical protein
MTETLILSIMMMAGLFLMLLGGVGFIQDKKFFSSAPKEVLAVVPESKPERFAGQHAVGWIMILFSLALMIGAILLGAWDGITKGLSFWQFFGRFLIMLLLLKAFDILFFDWFLLCNAGFNFFPHFYPDTKAALGRHLFGYNWKTHLAHIIATFPVSALLAWICALFCRH